MNERRIKINLFVALAVPLVVYALQNFFDYQQKRNEILKISALANFNEHARKDQVEQAKVLLQDIQVLGASVSEIASIADGSKGAAVVEEAEAILRLTHQMETNLKKQFWGTLIFFGFSSVFFFVFAYRLYHSVAKLAQSMRLVLDNTSQGFLVFDRTGSILPGFSKATEVLFGQGVQKAHALELVGVESSRFDTTLEALFNEPLPFEDVVALLPKEVECHGRIASIQMKPVRSSSGKIENILMVATDVTELREAEKEAAYERDLNRSLVKIISRKKDFLDLVRSVEQLDQHKGELTAIKIELHNLKSAFGMFSLSALSSLCHDWETRIERSPHPSTVDQAVDEIQERLRNFIFEHHAVLNLHAGAEDTITIPKVKFEGLVDELEKIHAPENIVSQVRHWVDRPPAEALSWLSEEFVATALKLGKLVHPIEWLPSDEIDVDSAPEMFQTLVHLVRNAADHGIEPPEERELLGKNRYGRMWAQLLREGEFVMMAFMDDGAGISIERIRQKAISKGISVPKTDEEILDLIFRPDFSTKEEVSEISGRGVGLYAIRQEARARGGDIRVENRPEGGTQFRVWFRLKTDTVENKENKAA